MWNTWKKVSAVLFFSLLIAATVIPSFASEAAVIQAFNYKPKGPGERPLGGAKLTLLANQTDSQMLSVVIETSKKGLIVVDGGTPGDASHLLETIRAKGGNVKAWFITHPHSDHVGALTEIINNPDSQITIENIYYNFTDISWYQTNEAYRADTVEKLMKSFESIPRDRLHGSVKKGDKITVDNIEVKVMNEPYLFDKNSINNSSVSYQFNINGAKLLFLGDMGEEAGARLMADNSPEDLKADMVQMAHHGQYGVSRQVYETIAPKICLWPTPGWLWDNDSGAGAGSGSWTTPETIQWMNEIGATTHYSLKDGDQTLE